MAKKEYILNGKKVDKETYFLKATKEDYKNFNKGDKARYNYYRKFRRNGRFVSEDDPLVKAIINYELSIQPSKKGQKRRRFTLGGDVEKVAKKVFNVKTMQEVINIIKLNRFETNTTKQRFFEILEEDRESIKKIKVDLDNFSESKQREDGRTYLISKEIFEDGQIEFNSIEELKEFLDQRLSGERGIVEFRYSIDAEGTLTIHNMQAITSPLKDEEEDEDEDKGDYQSYK